MMLGGVIAGYWATGKLMTATTPASVITIDITDAKIGRRMKKCESIATPPEVHVQPFQAESGPAAVNLSTLGFCAFALRLRRRFGGRLHGGFDVGLGPDTLHTHHNNVIVGRQAALDNAQVL